MPDIKLSDGKKIPFSKTIDGFEIADKISKSLAKEACIMSVDGVLKDLSFSINKTVSVKIIKFIDHCEEMPIAYGIANLVCSCSYEPEAFGRISVEAQSMQIPILASDIGGSKETIVKDKTGYLFYNKDPNALANSIVEIMQKDYNSLKTVGIEGRKNVLKKFDVDKMCLTTFTEYKKLIELS